MLYVEMPLRQKILGFPKRLYEIFMGYSLWTNKLFEIAEESIMFEHLQGLERINAVERGGSCSKSERIEYRNWRNHLRKRYEDPSYTKFSHPEELNFRNQRRFVELRNRIFSLLSEF